jgi:gliding motility associated protien GldN
MKKISVFILVLLASVASYAQHQVNSFFDDMGMVRLETQELKEASDSIVTVFHRADDVVWSRVVYRIIDLRFKQNYQLYTPVSTDDPAYASLFRTMLRGIENGMPIYAKGLQDFKPYFNVAPCTKDQIPQLLNTDFDGSVAREIDETAADIALSSTMLFNYDSINDKLTFNPFSYERFAKNTIKYMIQEVIFFDKHYSRLYSKIMAIAPMNPDNFPTMTEETPVMDALYGQILFWVPFDAFRPYMAQQYVTPRGNDNKRITFDDFFIQKMYSSYLVGVNNVFNRMIPQVANTYEGMQAEQRRIENELLTVEQDLWAY